jgi:hypothetical protein
LPNSCTGSPGMLISRPARMLDTPIVASGRDIGNKLVAALPGSEIVTITKIETAFSRVRLAWPKRRPDLYLGYSAGVASASHFVTSPLCSHTVRHNFSSFLPHHHHQNVFIK